MRSLSLRRETGFTDLFLASPLLPGSCQSVRMQFVALLPGVHSLDTLTLTDSDSDISTNLR